MNGDQLALLHIELLLLVDHPLVKTTGAQGLSPGNLLAGWLLERNDISHQAATSLR